MERIILIEFLGGISLYATKKTSNPLYTIGVSIKSEAHLSH
uniref:Uncharacterized protein n=1 Tax=Arundo donax TaxID=35708 RepID=A0A0A9GWH0_ARUDO